MDSTAICVVEIVLQGFAMTSMAQTTRPNVIVIMTDL